MSPNNGDSSTLFLLVKQTLIERGTLSIKEVVGIVGKHIPASRAVLAGQRIIRAQQARGLRGRVQSARPDIRYIKAYPNPLPLDQIAEKGRYQIVNFALSSLCRRGRIQRVGKGLYAPLSTPRKGKKGGDHGK